MMGSRDGDDSYTEITTRFLWVIYLICEIIAHALHNTHSNYGNRDNGLNSLWCDIVQSPYLAEICITNYDTSTYICSINDIV